MKVRCRISRVGGILEPGLGILIDDCDGPEELLTVAIGEDACSACAFEQPVAVHSDNRSRVPQPVSTGYSWLCTRRQLLSRTV
jgi:hypothetical protein